MASKKSSKNKHYPVVRQFPLSEGTHGGLATRIIDTGRTLSQVNRRLYRQGRYYEVKIDLEADSNTAFEVFAIRDDWAVQKGFQLAYNAYMENSKEERAHMAKTQIARWEDFRVEHGVPSSVVVGPQLQEAGLPVDLLSQGEFELTQVVIGAGTEKTFSWASVGTGSVYSILEEYDKAGNAQQSPTSVVSGVAVPYDDLSTDVDAAMAENLEGKGNSAPYTAAGVNANGPFVKIATLVSNSPNAQKLSTGYFCAPCGLIMIRQAAAADIRGQYSLTVKSGDYKGVHAPSMLE